MFALSLLFMHQWCVRITKQPTTGDGDLDDFEVSRFELGKIYDVGPRLAELLIACGFAEPERRERDRAADSTRK
jgi:hypothetical protein